MDGQRFDALARTVALSRRRALRALAGAALGGGLALLRGVGETAARPHRCHRGGQCGHGLVCCNGVCVECCTITDCLVGHCCNGTCMECCADGDCPSGRCCQGTCTDAECCTDSDCPGNCGVCHNGQCVAVGDLCVVPCQGCDPETLTCMPFPDGEPHPSCGSREVCCGGRCTNTLTDGDNCGGCGMPCSTCAVCDLGVCAVLPTNPCPLCQCKSLAGSCETVPDGHADDRCPSDVKSCCGGECIDVLTDEANCGDCGITCAAGQTCQGGKCKDECAEGLTSEGGTCTQPCPNGQTRCNGVCVDLQHDVANCGACGIACSTFGVGFDLCCDGTCVKSQSDVNNCAGCGNVCTTATGSGACCQGVCVDRDHDLANCGECGNDCSERGFDLCCNGECTDSQSDASNCGDCGIVCTTETNCCPACCLGVCVDLQTDNNNCDGCGKKCPSGTTCHSSGPAGCFVQERCGVCSS